MTLAWPGPQDWVYKAKYVFFKAILPLLILFLIHMERNY
jgi:hypothetical protein